MKNDAMNICMITDNNYTIYTGIALTSLKKCKKATSSYNIYILTDYIEDENKNRLLSLKDSTFNIEIITVRGYEKYQQQLEIKTISARPISLYKFKIPEILDFLDTVLYIDGDILFMKDIDEVFSTVLGEYYAAVTPENIISKKPPISSTRIGNDHLIYFNSGLMLMNLDKMRNDKIPEKLLYYRTHGKNFLMDQDAFNSIIGNNVICLSPIHFTSYYELSSRENFKKYGFNSKSKIIKNSFILHLATKNKPWVKKQPWITRYYLKFHKESPFKDVPITPYTYTNQLYNRIYDTLEYTFVFNIMKKAVGAFRKKKPNK